MGNSQNDMKEAYMNLDNETQRIIKSAANDTNFINAIKLVRMHLAPEATQPDISEFIRHLRLK